MQKFLEEVNVSPENVEKVRNVVMAARNEAVRSAPNDPIGFRGLGLAYEQQGEPAQAVKALRRYLKLAPGAADRELISKRIDKLSKRLKSK